MDFFECIASRRSVRAYRPDPVEEEKLEKLLETGRLAPTACDYQPFRVLVIRTAGREAELKRVYGKDWFAAAPLVLLVCSIPASAWSRGDGKNYADVDAAIVMDHIVLSATALGLGTCWVGAFTPLGYALESPAPRPRKALDELVLRR